MPARSQAQQKFFAIVKNIPGVNITNKQRIYISVNKFIYII